MGDVVVRVLLVLIVASVAGGVSLWFRRNAVYHPSVDVAGLGLPPGLVVFTSTECRRCKQVLAAARVIDVPLREVTYELEPELQERAGVVGVPLALVIDDSGRLIDQFAGVVRPGTLRRAVARAGFAEIHRGSGSGH